MRTRPGNPPLQPPVPLPPRPRAGLLEAALVVSLLAHLVLLLGLHVLQGPEQDAPGLVGIPVERVVIPVGEMERYREQRVAEPARSSSAPASAPVPPPDPPAVVLQPGSIARPRPTPPRVARVVDVAPTPRDVPSPSPSPRPSPSAAPAREDRADPPVPSPTPRGSGSEVAAASPTPLGSAPGGTQPAARPGGSDPGDASRRSPSPKQIPGMPGTGPGGEPAAGPGPGIPGPGERTTGPAKAPAAEEPSLRRDPRADFSLVMEYRNDARIPRDAKGFLLLDLEALCRLSQVKPILAEAPHGVIPLRQAPGFGLPVMGRARATVRVALELPGLPMPVPPKDVSVADVAVEGLPAHDDALRRLAEFIRAQVAASRWLPASDRGTWQGRSEEAFGVQVIQVAPSSVAEQAPGSPTAR